MDLQTLLEQRNISKYQLSKISGVPKTTIMDICAGRSNVERCSADRNSVKLYDGGTNGTVCSIL